MLIWVTGVRDRPDRELVLLVSILELCRSIERFSRWQDTYWARPEREEGPDSALRHLQLLQRPKVRSLSL